MAIPKALRQEVRQLKQRAERLKAQKIMVEGEKCIRELCKSSWNVERIYFTPPWEGSEFWNSPEVSREIERCETGVKDMEMMSALKTAPGLLAVAHFPTTFNRLPPSSGTVLFLDELKDPGNVGTLIRVADWFGLAGVVLSPGSADPWSPKALQSAMGSTFHIPVGVCSFQELPSPHLTHVVGLDAGGADLFSGQIPKPSLLVVGSESHGLSEDVVRACHAIASIPGVGRAESLNASVAGAVAVASFFQQGMS
jgi:RNA methyltransferase, TrmH family